jgi:NAD dependent epimerase/dehydratase family enzyme
MQTLATHYNRPLWLKMPAWVLEKTLGEMATLIVDSRRICAKKIQQFYTFKHPTLQHAITALDPKV